LTTNIELRGAVFIDQMQPQFAATVATNSEGFFPVAGEASFWLEVRPGIVINRLMDVALKSCDVKPGALITERSYGTLEVHSPDQGMVRQAGSLILKAAGLEASGALAPNVMTSETIRKIRLTASCNKPRRRKLATTKPCTSTQTTSAPLNTACRPPAAKASASIAS